MKAFTVLPESKRTALPTLPNDVIQHGLGFLDNAALFSLNRTAKLFKFHVNDAIRIRINQFLKRYAESVAAYTPKHTQLKQHSQPQLLALASQKVLPIIQEKDLLSNLLYLDSLSRDATDKGFNRRVVNPLQKMFYDGLITEFETKSLAGKANYLNYVLTVLEKQVGEKTMPIVMEICNKFFNLLQHSLTQEIASPSGEHKEERKMEHKNEASPSLARLAQQFEVIKTQQREYEAFRADISFGIV